MQNTNILDFTFLNQTSTQVLIPILIFIIPLLFFPLLAN